jgi:hypothetical protein
MQKSKGFWDFSFSEWAVHVSRDASARIQNPVASCYTDGVTRATYIYIYIYIIKFLSIPISFTHSPQALYFLNFAAKEKGAVAGLVTVSSYVR